MESCAVKVVLALLLLPGGVKFSCSSFFIINLFILSISSKNNEAI